MTARKDNKGRVLNSGESQRKNGLYMYRWVDFNKKRQCIYAKTLNDLRKKEKDIQFERLQGVTRENMTLNELIEVYISTKANIAPSTRTNYTYYYNHSIKDSVIGNMSITNIKKADILFFYKSLQNSGMANNTIAIIQKIIHPALQLAVDSDMLYKNASDRCLKEYATSKEIKYALSHEQEIEFIDRFDLMADSLYYKPLACIVLYTGMRISEALGLTWNDIDMQNKTININHQLLCRNIDGKLKLYCSKTKTKSGARIIPMNDLTYKYMIEQKRRWTFCRKVDNEEIDGYSNFIFLNYRTGKVVRHAVIRRLFRKIVREYNKTRNIQLPAVSPHILRHTYCTRLAEAGTDLKAMQYLMGHNDINTTLSVYNHINKDRLITEVNKINVLHHLLHQSDRVL